MSLRNLYRKHDQSIEQEQTPNSIFEIEQPDAITTNIPFERFETPKKDYKKEIETTKQHNPALAQTISNLNNYQQQALFSEAQNTLLTAMVGSGKTTVLTQKILYLHFVKKVPLSEMAVLTFTNKAAHEIRDRIESFYNNTLPEQEQMRYFGTFHSIARQINKEHPLLNNLGFTPSFSILDQEAKDDFLRRLILTHELDVKYQNKLEQRIKAYKNDKQLLYANMKHEDQLPQLLKLAQKEKQSNDVMDFDDLISVANWLLTKQKSFLPQWIIVDEFQDCNNQQMQLIKNLSTPSTNFFAVGDPNQSIYTWRGSNNSILNEIINDTSFQIMQLPLNYRTSEQLLNAAAFLLQTEGNQLQATRTAGEKLRITNHFDDQQEAHYYAQHFKQLNHQGTPWNQIAILVRTRQQLEIFQQIFSNKQIPHQVVSKQSLREQPALFWFQKLLITALHPNNLDSIIHLFCSKEFGILKQGKRLLTAIRKLENNQQHTTKLEAFVAHIKTKHKQNTKWIQLGEKLIALPHTLNQQKQNFDPYTFFQLDHFLKPTSIHFDDYKNQIIEAINQIKQFATTHNTDNWCETYQTALSQTTLEGHFSINKTIQTSQNAVQLLTIHAAKGLEFDHVYLSGANSGIIPLERKKETYDYLKEEKRLLFVALTRARNHMEISWHTQSQKWNAQEGPSYLLNSIPSNLIEKHQPKEPTPKTKPTTTKTSNPKWIPNTKVKHPKYGEGFIISSNDKEVNCHFGKFGEKNFALAWCMLEIIQ